MENKPHKAITQDSVNPPPDLLISMLNEYDVHLLIAVEKIYKNKVEEQCMTEDPAANKECDDHPTVRPLRKIMEVNKTEWDDPHNVNPGPGTITDQNDSDNALSGQEPEYCHQEDRLPCMYEKPDRKDNLDQDQPNAQKRIHTATSTLLQARGREDHYMVRDEAVHEVAEHETHKRNVTKIRSKMANNAHIPVKKYETLLEEEESANTYMDDANNTHQ